MNYAPLRIIINQYLMMQKKESISVIESSLQIEQASIRRISESGLTLKSQNLRNQSWKVKDKGLNQIVNQAGVKLKQLKFKVVKLIQCQLNMKLMAFSFNRLKENYLISRVINNFSVIYAKPISGELIDNPQSQLALKSKCQEKCQQRLRQHNLKMLAKPIFCLKLENQKLTNQVAHLKEEIVQSIKRQNKQVMKKSESLQGLMQQIADKNDFIEQLKSTITILEAKLGAEEKGVLHCLLQEDSQSLRKTIVRLQSVNDKLNFNLETNKKQNQFYQSQIKKLSQQCEKRQIQINKLKQHAFELQLNHQIVDYMKKQADLTQKRNKNKIQKTKKLQKKLSEAIKFKYKILQNQAEVDLQTYAKKSDASSTTSHLRRTSSIKSEAKIQACQNKLQAVFNFLFHIAQDNHQLQDQQNFEDQQKELLKTHKQIFSMYKKNHYLPTQRQETVDLSYIFGRSLHEALNPSLNKLQIIRDTQTIKKVEKQCQILISKICQLKQKHMHIRQVVMNFLKSYELKPLKKESELILNLMYQMFEYSQGERLQFWPSKSHKLFGFI